MTRQQTTFEPPPALAAQIAAQCGAFTARQAAAAGVAVAEIQDLRRRGSLVTLRRGVYALCATWDAATPEQRYHCATHAVLLVLEAPVALSHSTAALWAGLPLLRPDLTLQHVTRPALFASRREAGVHYHPGALPDEHVAVTKGVQVTSPARTAVDIARGSEFAVGLAAADSALRSGATRAELTAVLEVCRAWPGSRAASRVVVAADGRAANPGESLSRAVLTAAGLAPTDLQVGVRDRAGLVGYADMGWLPLRVLGEFDGRAKYGMARGGPEQALWDEKRREDRLRAAGFAVVRWTWADLLQPEPWLTRLRAELALAQALGHRGA